MSIGETLAFIACWYLFTITTYGVWVPSGLFLPGIIIGCSLGQLYGSLIGEIGPGLEEP